MNFNHNQQVLVATNNPGKYVEISKLLTAINLKPHSVIESKVIEPDEDGVSFAENALIKAKYYAKNFNMQSLSDDSGLCILDLENRPGIHSARYAINANGKFRKRRRRRRSCTWRGSGWSGSPGPVCRRLGGASPPDS